MHMKMVKKILNGVKYKKKIERGEFINIFHESEILDVTFGIGKEKAIDDIRFHMANFENVKEK